ncbi:Gfo/Idh/MocA family oxidoreductase, partial [bacterium]|nr:Gfo/Idh/MocA family oxidoreductase [bacterium]
MSVKIALIGCGRIAKRHAEHASKFGELVAVCDIDKVKAQNLAKINNANYYYRINELLKKESVIDIVSICTPNG